MCAALPGSACALNLHQFCPAGFEQNYSSPVIHFAKLTGLLANQTYFYTVGDGSTANTSPVLNFTTPPAPGAYPVRLYAMADLGQVRL